jgi:hypothetical protein
VWKKKRILKYGWHAEQWNNSYNNNALPLHSKWVVEHGTKCRNISRCTEWIPTRVYIMMIATSSVAVHANAL